MKKKQIITIVLLLICLGFMSSCLNEHEKITKDYKKQLMKHNWQIEKWEMPCDFHYHKGEIFIWNYFDEKEAYLVNDAMRAMTIWSFPENLDTIPIWGKKRCLESIYEFKRNNTIICHSSCGEQFNDTIKFELIDSWINIVNNRYNFDSVFNVINDDLTQGLIIDTITDEKLELITRSLFNRGDGVLIFKAVD